MILKITKSIDEDFILKVTIIEKFLTREQNPKFFGKTLFTTLKNDLRFQIPHHHDRNQYWQLFKNRKRISQHL